MSVQCPSAVVLIRPHHFCPNPATAADNAFQSIDPTRSAEQISAAAFEESTRLAETLEAAGIQVLMFEDTENVRPDSVFPNNWFSTHPGGRIALYPMFSPSRRSERRVDVIDVLKARFRVQDIIDFSGLEYDNIFLEGTGAMVLDHTNRVAYAAKSHRADPLALERFCATFGYEPMMFAASDPSGTPIYHTNVMMCIATDVALVGLSLIEDPARRAEVAERLTEPGRELVDLSAEQVADFAGNAIELRSPAGRILVMSGRAEASLTPEQRAAIERTCRIVGVEIPTIELAGGSVRCMIAGIHLDRRPVVPAVVALTESAVAAPAFA